MAWQARVGRLACRDKNWTAFRHLLTAKMEAAALAREAF